MASLLLINEHSDVRYKKTQRGNNRKTWHQHPMMHLDTAEWNQSAGILSRCWTA